MAAISINMKTPKAKPSKAKEGILKSAFIIISFELYPMSSIDTDARRATKDGENLIQAGKLQNLHHRVVDVEQGKRFSVPARGVKRVDQAGDTGAIDRGNAGVASRLSWLAREARSIRPVFRAWSMSIGPTIRAIPMDGVSVGRMVLTWLILLFPG